MNTSSRAAVTDWRFEETDWREEFTWFLVDEGVAWYCFRSREEASAFLEAFVGMPTLLLLDERAFHDVLMGSPSDPSCWRAKSPVLVSRASD